MSKIATVGAAKVIRSSVTFSGNIDGISATIVVANPAASMPTARFTKRDFETALGKVSRKVKK